MSANPESEGAGGRTCLACRGTGRLISGLGGTPHEVTCPWCRGTGDRIPGVNAQESPAETLPRPGADKDAGTAAQPNR
jgi:DnaJ-class molecular chaperone